ncbi:MAG: ParA family protein [Clostridia bacterium]|nr:ParA family protein [Clostridia bacterium]
MVISFTNQKGGVGKTTSAVNIAASLGALDEKVLLVDMDPQGNASTGVGLIDRNDTCTIYEVITGEAPVEAAIYTTEFKNLDVIPSVIGLAGAELEMTQIENRERLLKRALDSVRDKYDYIIIDCPPSLSLLTVNALVASDGFIIPVQCEYYALEGLVQLMNSVAVVKEYYNPHLSLVGVLVTMYNARLNFSGRIMEDLRNHYPDELFKTAVTRNVRLSEAPAFGTPVLYYDKFSKGAQSYLALAQEIIERTAPEENADGE